MLCRNFVGGVSGHNSRNRYNTGVSNTRPAILFGNYQIINIYVAECRENRRREIFESNLNETQCGFRPVRSNTDPISISSKILRNLEICQRRLHILCRPRESIRPGSLWKALGSVAWVRRWRPLMAAKSLYSCWDGCARVGRVKSRPFIVGVGLLQGCALSQLLRKVYISGFQPFCWRDPNPELWFCWRASLKFFNTIQLTFGFTAERRLLHEILDVLLKVCWGVHKGCLGAECGPQNRGQEPLIYMNWIDSHSRVDEGVTVGSCRINRLLFADELVLLASFQQPSACTRSVFCCG